jgi:hypothetical protein
MGDNIEYNSHILQMRTEYPADHHILFRGNIGYNHGAYAMQSSGVDNVYFYSNTLHDLNNLQTWAASMAGYSGEPRDTQTDGSTRNHNLNNIYSDSGPRRGPPISIDSRCASCSVTASNNLCFETGAHSSCSSTSNPLFVDSSAHNFYLQPSSPAIGLGKATTTVTSSSGSGTSFSVDDAGFFSDGYGIADGDIIKVGSNNPVRITSISSNTITVDRSISWNNGDGVYWRNQDSSPDVGAYEYRSGGYDYGISISSPANNAAVSGTVNILTAPTNPELIRQVIFYVDGIPVSRDFSSPFSFAWNTAGLSSGSSHVIDAIAYPLYASTELSKSSRAVVSIGTGTLPACVESDWSYTDGACQPSNTLTRVWTLVGSCQGGVSHPATETVSCAYVPPAVAGDLDGDGLVNTADFFIVVSDFGKTSGFNNPGSDTNSDSIIDIYDVVYVASRMG